VAAIEEIKKDIKTLENRRQLVAQMVQSMLGDYENLLRRVRSSGDQDITAMAAAHLRDMAATFNTLREAKLFSATEEKFVADFVEGMREASRTISYGKQMFEKILRRTREQQKVLGRAYQKISSLRPLQIEEASFFDNPDRREAVRRRRTADRKRHQ